MKNRPSHILPLLLDVRDPDFPTQCMGMTDQMRSEMTELIAGTKNEIATSRTLMAEIDRLLARR
jgi:hypothetical protein